MNLDEYKCWQQYDIWEPLHQHAIELMDTIKDVDLLNSKHFIYPRLWIS